MIWDRKPLLNLIIKKSNAKISTKKNWTVAALIVTRVAVFANPDKESLVGSEVLSLNGLVKATQDNKNQYNQKQNTKKTHKPGTKNTPNY